MNSRRETSTNNRAAVTTRLLPAITQGVSRATGAGNQKTSVSNGFRSVSTQGTS